MFQLKHFLFFISLLFINVTFSQEFRLSGSLVNQIDQLPLPGATLKLVNLRDTLNFSYQNSGLKGEFTFQKLVRGRYRLEVTYIGFENYVQIVIAGGKTTNLGTIALIPSATNLSGVEITNTAVRAEQKGDTTQYNAGAFKVTQDATTEDLVKKMPGITIENGTVKAHGEDVKRVLVDGKQFFGEDPSVTLKNLPAEVVDKIQVFDKLSDQAAWTGFDDGSGQKTINIVTRNSKRSGQFGKFSAGYGTDGRYLLGANVNFFKGDRKITLLGMSNNVNQQNFSADDVIGSGSGGRSSGMPGGRPGGSSFQVGPQSGIFSTHAIGVNYTDAYGKMLTLNASYFWNAGTTTSDKQVNRQYILGENVSQYYNEISSSASDNINHRLNMRIEFNPDSNNSFILTPRLSLQDNTSNSYSAAITGLDPEFTLANLINQSINKNDNTSTGYNFNNDLLYRYRFAKKGRTASINLSTGVTHRYKDNYLNSLSDYYTAAQSPANDTLQQYGKTLSDGLSLSSNLVYTEPLGEKNQLQFSYNASWSENNNDKKTYDYVLEQKQYTLFDTLLSNIYDNGYITQRWGSGFLRQTEKMSLNAGVTYQYAELKGNTSFPFVDSTKKTFNTVLPNVMLNYKFTKLTNLRVSYRASTNSPSTGQLQKVVDNSNPLLLSTGNPGLQQEIRHFAMTRFSHANKDKTANLFGMLFFQKTLNYIGNSTLVAPNDTVINGQAINRGTQLTVPENLDGAWNARFLTTVGFPLKPIKSNLNFNTGISYNRLPSRMNSRSNLSNTYGLNLGAVLSSNISQKLDFTFTYNVNYNLVENTIQPQLDNNYFFQIGSVQFNWEFWKGFFMQTSVTYQNYNGISSNITDRYTLWNFNLGKKIFKNNSGEIKLSCYDILDENKSLNRNVTDSYIEDSNTEVLRQYFMLSFTYNLRNFTGPMPGPGGEKRDFEGRPEMRMH
jgi:hypothetical protein